MCDCCLVDGAFLLTLALNRAGLLSAGAGLNLFGGKFVKQFSVMTRYDLTHVRGCSITNLCGIFVEYFMQWV